MKRLMIFLVFFILGIVALFIGQFNAPSLGENLWTKSMTIFGFEFWLVNILFGAIAFFISVMIILLIGILLGRIRRERRERIREELIPKYQNLLLLYLSHEYPDDKKYFDDISDLEKSGFRKQILIDQIIDVAKNLRGINLQKLQELYFGLKLHKKTFRKIKWGIWHRKIKGIKEISALSLYEKKDLILKYSNSRNSILRMEAQTALIDLSRFDKDPKPFEFLDHLTVPFSTWEQISIYQTMIERGIEPPDFLRWLFSDNHTVILFCLRMIREYKQVQNASYVKDLAWHDNEEVRKLAYEVMGDLKMVPQLKEVRKLFKDETPENRREMIRSMRKAADPTLINFLRRVIDSEDDAETLVEAVRGIKDAEGGNEILDKMMKDTYKNYNIIIKHVKDRKIS
ncbi:MAG TPA: HEAT repeat domain-containing protein [Candidatus Paceibacterota bacterium]|nr:HEAT repeat domain-containing protein [Candidatus Paceibacterota bacterium]